MNGSLLDKTKKLKSVIAQNARVAVAYSGGVDSTLLLAVAHEVLGADCIAITAEGAMIPASELEESQRLAAAIGVEPIGLPMDVFTLDAFVDNGPKRCYFCKKNIFTAIMKHAKENGCVTILDGTNVDDLGDYRPGLKALEELSVVSPFVEAGMTKADIRALSAELGLPTATKPAMACLATRIPTGTPITPTALAMVEAGEERLKALGLQQYRLRLIDGDARIECDAEDFPRIMENREALITDLQGIGIKGVSLDLSGYSCGSMNKPTLAGEDE